MTSFSAACVQLRSGKNARENFAAAEVYIRSAAQAGATYVQTPEMSNLLVRHRAELMERISPPEADVFLTNAIALAKDLGIYLHLGSLAVLVANEKVANRAFMIGPNGTILATYDKIHMFDVDLPNGESWRESATYEPGQQSIVVDLPFASVGMAVCYDIRFPDIFRSQARLGANVLTGPAAFTRQTGQAHWHVLQRARAIENGAFVVSAAQGGTHADGRETFGHSLIVDPWGKVIAEAQGDEPGFILSEINIVQSKEARERIPAIANERDYVSRRQNTHEEVSA